MIFRSKKRQASARKGVVIVEYVLLLVACVAIANIIVKAVEKDTTESGSGWLIKSWMKVIRVIAED